MKLRFIFLATLWMLCTNTIQALEKEVFSVTLSKNTENFSNSAEIIAKITNNSENSIKVLKWGTPFEEKLRSNIFHVVLNNIEIEYIGMKLKHGEPTEEDYIVFQPNETKVINIDISNFYKMKASGTYHVAYQGFLAFAVDASSGFTSNKIAQFKKLKLSSSKIDLELETPNINKYTKSTSIPDYQYCTSNQISEINIAYKNAVELSAIASSDMNNTNGRITSPRYREWFGESDTLKRDIVKNNFNIIHTSLNTKDIKFSCDDSNCSSSDVAYTYAGQPHTINICNQFWDATEEGANSKAGTIIHAISQFSPKIGTQNSVYNQVDTKHLATYNPESAIYNANSYEYFTENTSSLTMESKSRKVRALEMYTISGTVRDIVDGSYVEGATISLYRNGHGRGTVISDSSGHYIFENVVHGSYTLRINASAYIADTDSVAVTNSNVNKRLNLVRRSASGDYRVVLTWGGEPSDLDSHLLIANPNDEGCGEHIYYADKRHAPYGNLDVDDTTSYGPETIKITKFVGNKDHEYWVRDYRRTGLMGKSKAVVKVYRGCRLLKVYNVSRNPRNTRKEHWHVFDISRNGIRTVNKYITGDFGDSIQGECGTRRNVPRKPISLRASRGTYSNFIYLNNYSSFGATKYEIYRADSYYTTLQYLGATYYKTFKDYAADPKKSYYYAVRACNYNGCSQLSSYAKGFKKRPHAPASPKHIRATDGFYHDFVYLNHYAVRGATKYRIYRKDSFNAPLKYLGSTYSTGFRDVTAKVGKFYYYSIRACNNVGCSALSSFNRGYRKRPVTPSNIHASDGVYIGYVYLNHYAVRGATKYRIYRKDSFNAPLKYLGSTYSTSFRDVTAKVGKNYYYSVRSCYGDNCSALSDFDRGYKRTPPIPLAPKHLQASKGRYNNLVYLNNYSVFGATTYRIYRKHFYNEPLKYLGATHARSFRDITVSNRKSYYYSIRACNSRGCSALSSYSKGWSK